MEVDYGGKTLESSSGLHTSHRRQRSASSIACVQKKVLGKVGNGLKCSEAEIWPESPPESCSVIGS